MWGPFTKCLILRSTGKITFQTKSLLIKVLPFTFLLYALDTLSFCLFVISNARSLSSSRSTNSFIINSQYMLGGIYACLCIKTDCKYISTGSTASCPNVNWKGVVFVASFGDVRQAQSAWSKVLCQLLGFFPTCFFMRPIIILFAA